MKSIAKNDYFTLFPNVIPVAGYNRSCLVDLYTHKLTLVPNDLLDFIRTFNRKRSISENLSMYNREEKETVQSYLSFLLENELGTISDSETIGGLLPLPEVYRPDSRIRSAILELKAGSDWDVAGVIAQLSELGTRFLEVRFLDVAAFKTCASHLKNALTKSMIESVHLLIPDHADIRKSIFSLKEADLRFSKITVYNARTGFEPGGRPVNLIFTRQQSIEHSHCGQVSPAYFAIGTGTYSYAKNFNTCLAHKLSVRADGTICNCPSAKAGFGNVAGTTLKKALNTKLFTQHWRTTKDQVRICAHCEFRHVCKDCRVFKQDPADPFSKPSKCGYNPFISKWENEPGYVPEQECGIFDESGDFLPDQQKLETLNRKLWKN